MIRADRRSRGQARCLEGDEQSRPPRLDLPALYSPREYGSGRLRCSPRLFSRSDDAQARRNWTRALSPTAGICTSTRARSPAPLLTSRELSRRITHRVDSRDGIEVEQVLDKARGPGCDVLRLVARFRQHRQLQLHDMSPPRQIDRVISERPWLNMCRSRKWSPSSPLASGSAKRLAADMGKGMNMHASERPPPKACSPIGTANSHGLTADIITDSAPWRSILRKNPACQVRPAYGRVRRVKIFNGRGY